MMPALKSQAKRLMFVVKRRTLIIEHEMRCAKQKRATHNGPEWMKTVGDTKVVVPSSSITTIVLVVVVVVAYIARGISTNTLCSSTL